ncbi:MAG: hypothetical protein R3Y47_05430 [Lachnospiraceae bacterium]
MSKRNSVMLIERDGMRMILKEIKEEEAFTCEKTQLELLHKGGVRVPTIQYCEGLSLGLSYLEGETLLDHYLQLETEGASEEVVDVIDSLLDWFEGFYRINKALDGSQMIKSDMNFRNFLLVHGEVYGIDFEQVKIGEIEEDIGRMAAFALMYDPIETEFKKMFVHKFIVSSIERLSLSEDKVRQYYEDELSAMKIRRAKKLGREV